MWYLGNICWLTIRKVIFFGALSKFLCQINRFIEMQDQTWNFQVWSCMNGIFQIKFQIRKKSPSTPPQFDELLCNVCPAEKRTKHSSMLLLRLVQFSTGQTLVSQSAHFISYWRKFVKMRCGRGFFSRSAVTSYFVGFVKMDFEKCLGSNLTCERGRNE